MSRILLPSARRHSLRRAATLDCEVVSLERYRLLGCRALDVSHTGLLLAAHDLAEPEERVLVHLFTGDADLVAEAEVARVLPGLRRSDRGAGLGLRFTRLPRRRFARFMSRLRGTPPPVPRRPIRIDYAASVRNVAAASARVSI